MTVCKNALFYQDVRVKVNIMKALTIWVGIAVLLLGMSFQVQAQTVGGYEITGDTTLGQIRQEFGVFNTDSNNVTSLVVGPERSGSSAQIVTITYEDGTQTILYIFQGKVIGMLITPNLLIVFNSSEMDNNFPIAVSQYGTVQQRTVATISGGGDNTASRSSP